MNWCVVHQPTASTGRDACARDCMCEQANLDIHRRGEGARAWAKGRSRRDASLWHLSPGEAPDATHDAGGGARSGARDEAEPAGPSVAVGEAGGPRSAAADLSWPSDYELLLRRTAFSCMSKYSVVCPPRAGGGVQEATITAPWTGTRLVGREDTPLFGIL